MKYLIPFNESTTNKLYQKLDSDELIKWSNEHDVETISKSDQAILDEYFPGGYRISRIVDGNRDNKITDNCRVSLNISRQQKGRNKSYINTEFVFIKYTDEWWIVKQTSMEDNRRRPSDFWIVDSQEGLIQIIKDIIKL